MRASFVSAVAAVTLTLACAPVQEQGNAAREQGRTYTAWFYGQQFDKLWAQLSPEMQATFGSPQGLASFAGETVRDLGAETGSVSEVVEPQDSLQVYTRRATFERGADPVLLQWTLTPGGVVTGFVVRPDVGRPRG